MSPNPVEREYVVAVRCAIVLLMAAFAVFALTGCVTPERGSLADIHQRAFLDCYTKEDRYCMRALQAEDDACGAFCDVLHGGQPDWVVCNGYARGVCQQ